ncbi:hypothetical protein IT413_02550 [Candidatus Peregrinibacteria bacterium]|nr:hypothetical protein [Candidatus Peregrinibacteria bacterium]
MKNCRSLLSSDLVSPRLVFFNPGEKPPDDASEKAKEGQPKSTEQLMAEAKVALEDAKAERGNIEEHYGKADEKGKLPSGTPAAIQEQFTKLGETVKTLEAAQKKPKAVIEATLAQVDAIFANLDSASKAAKEKALPGDPMAGLEYTPRGRSAKPDVAADKADAAKKAEAAKPAPAKVDGKKDVIAEEQSNFVQVLDKIANGAKELSPEDRSILKKGLVAGVLRLEDGQNGESFDVEMSKDKKWVRVNVNFQPKEGMKKEAITRVFALEDNVKSQPEFKFKSQEEIDQKGLERNQKDLEKQLAWIDSKDAPLGSTVIVRSEQITRKNAETGADETVIVATGVRKGLNGLRVVYLESGTNEKGEPVVKEVKSGPYKKEDVMVLAPTQGSITAVEGSAQEKKAELKKGMDDLAHTLMAYFLPPNGVGTKGFEQQLSTMKKVISEYNIGKFVHKDTYIGYQVRVENGAVSIVNPKEKNPDYKSPEETPNVSRYAVKYGPKDVSSIA